MSTTATQFGRAASLIVTGSSGAAFELSRLSESSEGLRFRFTIVANDVENPNTAYIRVYNLSEETTRAVINEYNGVILSAGYSGNVAQIFKGTIKQFRRGKERNVDSFLDIYAADGDIAYNFATINVPLKEGSSAIDEIQQLVNSFAKASGVAQQITLDQNAIGYITVHSPSPNIRGKVMWGLARDYMRDLANTFNLRWSIQNGVLTLIPITGYLPGNIIPVNSQTGMIGSPEATDQGIIIKTLLNPLYKVGTAVELNNVDITATTIKQQLFPGYKDLTFIAKVDSTAPDGLYRVLVIEHEGDTRDQEWYSTITCLLIDASSPPSDSVAAYGQPAGS